MVSKLHSEVAKINQVKAQISVKVGRKTAVQSLNACTPPITVIKGATVKIERLLLF